MGRASSQAAHMSWVKMICFSCENLWPSFKLLFSLLRLEALTRMCSLSLSYGRMSDINNAESGTMNLVHSLSVLVGLEHGAGHIIVNRMVGENGEQVEASQGPQ